MEILGKHWNEFDDFCESTKYKLNTGFQLLDSKLRGLSGLTTLQGEPKSCKSSFCLNIALHNALRKIPVLWIDYENGLQFTRLRVLSQLCQISAYKIEEGSLNEKEKRVLKESQKTIDTLPFYYFEEMPDEIERLYLNAKKHRKQALIVLDSLQSTASDHTQKRAEADRIMWELNALKNKYLGEITIIVVSEKNRQSYGSAQRAGAKESSSVEYKSEVVLDLHRKMLPDGNYDDTIHLNCNHNRHGPDGYIGQLVKPTPYCYKLESQEVLPE